MRLRERSLWVATCVWALAVATGMALVWRYKNTPGREASAPEFWPRTATLARPSGRATLLLFAHPRCPCTRASLAELEAIVEAVGDAPVSMFVVFIRPNTIPDFEKTDAWRAAQEIPGVQVRVDPDGVEAQRFGSKISGQTLIYDAEGRLVFRGGITGSRGHSGDNLGRRRAIALLTGADELGDRSPVFGCPLVEPADQKQGEGP